MARSSAAPKAATRRVLLAEDNVKLRRIMARYLRTVGYTVDEAHNGIEALEMMRARTPDAILLDMQMPDMDGRTLLATSRRDPRLAVVPVVVLSGQPADEAAANEIGARAYLMKPIDLDVLRSVLDRVTQA
jgi:CheY-like chemotaxis protein